MAKLNQYWDEQLKRIEELDDEELVAMLRRAAGRRRRNELLEKELALEAVARGIGLTELSEATGRPRATIWRWDQAASEDTS